MSAMKIKRKYIVIITKKLKDVWVKFHKPKIYNRIAFIRYEWMPLQLVLVLLHPLTMLCT